MKQSGRLKLRWLGGVLAMLVFVVFTCLVKWVDVRVDGEHAVGWGAVNFWWRDLVGVNRAWAVVSDAAVVMTGVAVLIGLGWQLVLVIRSHRLPRAWWVFDLALAAVVLFYVLFQILVVNYRPDLTNHGGEASYPSSHVFWLSAVCPLLILAFGRMVDSRVWRGVVHVAGCVLGILGIVARVLAGYHWLTDILGGVLLGLVVVAWAWVAMDIGCQSAPGRLNCKQ